MSTKKQAQKKSQVKNIGQNLFDIFSGLGGAISEVLSDPKLKAKTKELAKDFKDSASTLANRFKDEDVKKKFSQVGETAKKFGKQMEREGVKIGKRAVAVGKKVGKKVAKRVKK